jgi:hypothetical protein
MSSSIFIFYILGASHDMLFRGLFIASVRNFFLETLTGIWNCWEWLTIGIRKIIQTTEPPREMDSFTVSDHA